MSEAIVIGATSTRPVEEVHGFAFTGSAGEFFRIWIVNICLTVLTLGIYSAWAKVRTSRYFAANTHLAGDSFDYLADPVAILKGRLIVLVFVAAYSLSSTFAPLIAAPIGLVLLVAFPWAICRSLAFRAHNTAWRNIRFAFGGRYGEAFIAYLVMPPIGMILLGLGYPYAIWAQRGFMVDNAAFGTTRFEFGSTPGQFYGMFGRLILLVIAAAFFFTMIMSSVAYLGSGPEPDPESALALVPMLAMVPIYFMVFAFYAAWIANLTYDRARLGPHELVSRVPFTGLAWIYFTNGLAIVASLGLLIPWSHVRLARFRLSHMGLVARGSLDDFAAAQGDDVSALGTEFGEAFDFDLGL